jgi:hypothetical protein
LTFFLFYIASSCAITQERAYLTVEGLEHSSYGEKPQFNDSKKDPQNDYPRYRQAKPKTICALTIARNPALEILPHVSERSFAVQTHSLKPEDIALTEPSRAPPLTATAIAPEFS